MKLNLLGLLVTSLLAQTVFAAKYTQLVCEGQRHTHFRITKNWSASGNIAHNYSTAVVACSGRLEHVLSRAGQTVCYGVWSFDLGGQNRDVVDTMAWVKIVNDGQKITAQTQTNKAYGSKILDLNCQLVEVEQRNRGQ